MKALLITDEGLNCPNCYQIYEETGEPPVCRTPHGCPVPDAADPVVNEFISRFRLARTLFEINKISSIYEKELEALGLIEDTPFLFELEMIFAKWQQKKSNESKDSNQWNKVLTD